MLRQFSLKVLLGAFLVVPLVLGTVSVVKGVPEPPPEGTHPVGPGMVAQATITPGTLAQTVNVVFVGRCKGQTTGPLEAEQFIGVDFAEVTADNMVGFRVAGLAQDPNLAFCYGTTGAIDIIVQAVTSFIKNGNVIDAQVVLMGLI